jgi:hypothetical protein
MVERAKMFSVAIIYTPKSGRPFKLAGVSDRSLLRQVAGTALSEIESSMEMLGRADPVLGAIQNTEAMKLRKILMALMLPNSDEPAVRVM